MASLQRAHRAGGPVAGVSRIVALVVSAAALTVIALAIPRLFPGSDDEPLELLQPVVGKEPVEAPEEAPDEDDGVAPAEEERARPPVAVQAPRTPAGAGDLGVALSLRWKRYPAWSAIQAEITLENVSPYAVHVPAPDEPQPTLALVVVDEAGACVRRVVEDSVERLPRRMRRVEPGGAVQLRMDLLAQADEPLPPGAYRVFALYDADPAWERSGLDVWTAPSGPRQSERVAFEITSE